MNVNNFKMPEGYKYEDLFSLLLTTLKSGISVLLRGHPGVGKSSLARELAREMNLPLIDIRLAQRDPVELGGVYYPDKDTGTLRLMAPEWVSRACREGCFVFLDEFNSAITRLHQSVAYQIVLERRIGENRFHPDTVVMGAGNLEEDNAIVSSLSSALCNRFAHFILRPDVASWLKWGSQNGIDESILAYIGNAGLESLYSNTGEYSFPSPRSWEMASRVYRNSSELDRKRAMSACVGVLEAENFFSYMRLFGKIDVEKIVRKGQKMAFDRGEKSEPSFIYAAVFAVAAYICNDKAIGETELGNIVAFLQSKGLSPEYKLLFLRHVNSRSGLIARLKPLPEFHKLAGELVSLNSSLYINN